MRRSTGAGMGILALSVILIVGGISLVTQPNDMVVLHQGRRPISYVEHVSKGESQMWGTLAVALGVVLARLVFYGRKK